VSSSKGEMESLVLGEKTGEKKPLSLPLPSLEPIISEPKIELIDKCVLEVEPDNLTISVCCIR
jgi:hypothetical protein